MNILNIEHVSKLYGDKWIFDDISCGIQEGEKIGIIGINGTGKTTLLRIIAGTEEPDQGQVVRQNGGQADVNAGADNKAAVEHVVKQAVEEFILLSESLEM